MSRRLIARLAHVEIFTPSPEQSLRFSVDVLGLEETTREGRSVYLRGWGEWSHHSLQLTEAAAPGLGHIGWRTWSAEDLESSNTYYRNVAMLDSMMDAFPPAAPTDDVDSDRATNPWSAAR